MPLSYLPPSFVRQQKYFDGRYAAQGVRLGQRVGKEGISFISFVFDF
jgi:hypothetical protein